VSAAIAVLLVDDHAIVREGYRRLLEENPRIVVVAEATNAAEAYERFCRHAPSVVVMDIALRGPSGIECTRRILAHQPAARVLIFSMYEDAIFVERALDAGAAGYLTKTSAPEVLVEAVMAVAAGKPFLSHDVAQLLALSRPGETHAVHRLLSAREFEIFKLWAQGESVGEIAGQLGLTQKTVANHQSTIKQKLRVDTPIQLVRLAMRLGLADAGLPQLLDTEG
jgi:two-component system invasion response regulator UvrY